VSDRAIPGFEHDRGFVRVNVRMGKGYRSFWGKKVSAKGDMVKYYEVTEEGDVELSVKYNKKTNVEHVTKHLYVVNANDIVSEKEARVSLKYGNLEVVDAQNS